MRSAVAIAMLAAVGHAQIDWQVHGARTRARVVQQGGEIQVHFPVQGGGKPASLAFPAEAGAHVVVACEREPRARERAAERARKLRLAEDSVCRRGIEGDSLRVRTAVAGEDAPGDYRVQATVEARERGTFGLVGRSRDGQGRYLFAIDWQRRVATLERWLDSDHVVLARAELERLAAAPTLMLQLEGFRLSAFLDDEPVLRALDGALRAGAPGVAWQGDQPLVRDLRIAPPVPQTASAALVQRSRVAFLYARVTVPPGNLYCVELRLDRPHPFVPRTVNGMEPRLNGGGAAPVVLLADWRDSLGENGIGWVDARGRIAARIVVPDLPALRHQVALVRALLVTPGGEQVVGATPTTRLIL